MGKHANPGEIQKAEEPRETRADRDDSSSVTKPQATT